MSDEAGSERDPLRLLPDFHRSTRMPLDAVVRLHFEGTVAYQNGFAANVSALGMFVKHPEPPEVGTRLVFEFVLGDERKPVQGGGVVTWARERYEGPGRPAGVGIQFTELDALSRQHIAEALFEYLESSLGVAFADHPDVPDLLAAMPDSTVVDIGGDEIATKPGVEEPQKEMSFDPSADWASDGAAEVADEEEKPEPFRLFAESSDLPPSFDTESLGTQREEIFSPVTPPEPFEIEESLYGAARRRESPTWLPLVIAFGIAAAGFLGWWFLWGPGAEARQAREVPAIAAEPTPVPRPRLDPQPGTETTLAQAVGASVATADESDIAGSNAAVESAGEAPAPTAIVPPTVLPQPAPAAEVAPATSAGPATRVTDIRWRSQGAGTEITLAGDGAFAAGSYRWFEMRGEERPRVLVRLTGMAAGYPRTSLDVGTFELAGIRVGYHQKPAGNELHIVLDLASRDVRVESVGASGNQLLVRLRQP